MASVASLNRSAAFRDTWKDGIHSYLSYLRDRLVVARELLTESGSMFIQIGDENVHLSQIPSRRGIWPRQFCVAYCGPENHWCKRRFDTKHDGLSRLVCKEQSRRKVSSSFHRKISEGRRRHAVALAFKHLTDRVAPSHIGISTETGNPVGQIYRIDNLTSQSMGRDKGFGAASWFEVGFQGSKFTPTQSSRWKTNEIGMLTPAKSKSFRSCWAHLVLRPVY